MLKEKWMDALKHLGMGRLCHPVFCHCPVALRLEVGEPNLPVGAAYFARAGQFVERLFHRLDACFDLLCIQCVCLRTAERIREAAGLPVPGEIWMDGGDDERPVLLFWSLPDRGISLRRLLGEVLYSDFGGCSQLASAVFLLDSRSELLVHLYDDRGVDLAAVRADQLKGIYQEFGSRILPGDRERIDRIFQPGEQS